MSGKRFSDGGVECCAVLAHAALSGSKDKRPALLPRRQADNNSRAKAGALVRDSGLVVVPGHGGGRSGMGGGSSGRVTCSFTLVAGD